MASTEAVCLPAAFVTVLCKAKSMYFASLSLALSHIHLLMARTNSQTQVPSFQSCLHILPLIFFILPRFFSKTIHAEFSHKCWLLFLDWSQTNVRWNNKHETINKCVHCDLLNTQICISAQDNYLCISL